MDKECCKNAHVSRSRRRRDEQAQVRSNGGFCRIALILAGSILFCSRRVDAFSFQQSSHSMQHRIFSPCRSGLDRSSRQDYLAHFTSRERNYLRCRPQFKLFTSTNDSLLEEIKGMRVKQLKEELKAFGVPTNDVFEKDELVRRLVETRNKRGAAPNKATAKTGTSTTSSTSSRSSYLNVPMQFFALEARSISASSSGDIYIRPSPGEYPAIELDLGRSGILTMLVDTACSGIVLRPSSAAKHNLRVVDNPISMTSAGGTADTKLSQIDSFTVQGKKFGPAPVAVQDIGALPSQLDGILGLQLLNQFAVVDFDFENRVLRLGDSVKTDSFYADNGKTLVAEGELMYTRLGIWALSVTMDGNGPVKLLLDTGAASSILNWKGVADLGLSRSSPEVSPNTSPIGAMGADNIALQLTHRITLSKILNLTGFKADGLDLTQDGTLDVDIGTLPVLDMLLPDGVGGILGSDALMRCRSVRLNLKGSTRKVYFYQ
jgi:predicted aspartyl protease